MTYVISAIVLTAINAACVFVNLLMLPGNWLMVGTLGLFLLIAGDPSRGPDWSTMLIVIGLAILGELAELIGGSAKAAKRGASRRAMILSLGFSVVGSIAGAILAVPIPVIGSAIGAVVGAAAGAFSGAWVGEAWKGTDASLRNQIGSAAMTGRLLGMLAKLVFGIAIFVFQVVSLWL